MACASGASPCPKPAQRFAWALPRNEGGGCCRLRRTLCQSLETDSLGLFRNERSAGRLLLLVARPDVIICRLSRATKVKPTEWRCPVPAPNGCWNLGRRLGTFYSTGRILAWPVASPNGISELSLRMCLSLALCPTLPAPNRTGRPTRRMHDGDHGPFDSRWTFWLLGCWLGGLDAVTPSCTQLACSSVIGPRPHAACLTDDSPPPPPALMDEHVPLAHHQACPSRPSWPHQVASYWPPSKLLLH